MTDNQSPNYLSGYPNKTYGYNTAPLLSGQTYHVKTTTTCPDNKQLYTTDATSSCCTWPSSRNVANGSCGSYTKSGFETYAQKLDPVQCTYAKDTSVQVDSTACVCLDPSLAAFDETKTRVNGGSTCPPTGSSYTSTNATQAARGWMINQGTCRTATYSYTNTCYGASPCHVDQPCNTRVANFRSSSTAPETGSCQTATYKWTITGASSDEGHLDAIAGIPQVGSACSPTKPSGGVDTSACYQPSGGGGELYSNCYCNVASSPGCTQAWTSGNTTYTHPCTLVDVPNHPGWPQVCKECTLDITTAAGAAACQPN